MGSLVASKLIDGVIGALSADYTNRQNAKLMSKQNAFNASEAQKNRDFQLHMFSQANAYNSPKAQVQRYMEAGLNPALMYGGNAGSFAAVAPQGAQAQSSGLIPKMDLAQAAANIEKTRAETDLIKSQKGNTEADTKNKLTQQEFLAQYYQGQIDLMGVQVLVGKSQDKLLATQEKFVYRQYENLAIEADRLRVSIDEIKSKIENLDSDTALKKIEHAFQSENFETRLKQSLADLKKTNADINLSYTQAKGILESLIIQRCRLTIDQQNADTNRLNAYTAMSSQEAYSDHLRVVDGQLQFDLDVSKGKHTKSRAAKERDWEIANAQVRFFGGLVGAILGFL